MILKVLVGDDEQRVVAKKEELLNGEAFISVDCSEDPQSLIDAVQTKSLFAATQNVWALNFEALDDKLLDTLLNAGSNSEAIIVARSATLSPARKKKISGVGEVLTLSKPKGKGVALRVNDMIKNSGLVFNPAARRVLTERVGHDTERISSILEQCKILGLSNPTQAQITTLVGSSAAPGVPWSLSDAIENNSLLTAMSVTTDLVPIASAAYLANRFMTVGKIVEADTEELKENVLKGVAPFQAEKLIKMSKTLENRTGEAAILLARFDQILKSSQSSEHTFNLLVIELCDLFRK